MLNYTVCFDCDPGSSRKLRERLMTHHSGAISQQGSVYLQPPLCTPTFLAIIHIWLMEAASKPSALVVIWFNIEQLRRCWLHIHSM